MKIKAIILAVILGIVFFGVSQTTFSQDGDSTRQVESTEKISKEIQELKDNFATKEDVKRCVDKEIGWAFWIIMFAVAVATIILAVVVIILMIVGYISLLKYKEVKKEFEKGIKSISELKPKIINDIALAEERALIAIKSAEQVKKEVEEIHKKLSRLNLAHISGDVNSEKFKKELKESAGKEGEIGGLFDEGIHYYNEKKYQKAIDSWNRIIDIKPDDKALIMAYNNIGLVYGKDLKEYEKAMETFNKAIELNPKDTMAYYNRGTAYAELRQFKKAIVDYTKAIEINPKNVDAYNNRGAAYIYLKQYNKAIEDCTKAIEINPKNVDAYNNRGAAYIYLKQYNKTIEDCTKALKINPKYASAHFNFACAYALKNEEGDRDKMLEYLKNAIELDDKCKKDAKEEDDFKAYRDDPDFKKLVE